MCEVKTKALFMSQIKLDSGCVSEESVLCSDKSIWVPQVETAKEEAAVAVCSRSNLVLCNFGHRLKMHFKITVVIVIHK